MINLTLVKWLLNVSLGDEKYYKLETRSNDNSILERKHEISRCVTLDNNNISF